MSTWTDKLAELTRTIARKIEGVTMFGKSELDDVVTYWEHSVALADLLEERDGRFTDQRWDTIISAVRSNLPLVVTVTYGPDRRSERFTAMVEYFTCGRTTSSNYLRLRSWGGFVSNYYLGEIEDISTPERVLV